MQGPKRSQSFTWFLRPESRASSCSSLKPTALYVATRKQRIILHGPESPHTALHIACATPKQHISWCLPPQQQPRLLPSQVCQLCRSCSRPLRRCASSSCPPRKLVNNLVQTRHPLLHAAESHVALKYQVEGSCMLKYYLYNSDYIYKPLNKIPKTKYLHPYRVI